MYNSVKTKVKEKLIRRCIHKCKKERGTQTLAKQITVITDPDPEILPENLRKNKKKRYCCLILSNDNWPSPGFR